MRPSRAASIGLAVALTAALAMVPASPAEANHAAPFDGPQHEYGEVVDYPMVFPVGGENRYSASFWAARGTGIHHGIDIMSPKMTPVVAVADGVVGRYNGGTNQAWIDSYSRCCTLWIAHDDGWTSKYIHLNNDTPGTDDGQGWGIAPDLALGTRVQAGQVIGWVGDSGNAEGTSPHLHFELMDPDGVLVDPYESLRSAATGIPPTICKPATASLDNLLGSNTLIKQDTRGVEVRELQAFLAAVGHDPGPIDGVAGSKTITALRAFQEARGIAADGVVGPTTRQHIDRIGKVLPVVPALDTTNRILRPGYRGEDAKSMQKLLALAGYDPGPADGVYGPKTEAAVAAFQRAYGGLDIDGKIGPATRAALATFLGLGNVKACSG
ncbi:MAG: peptidoglycan-binding protein [Acidimicrobiia bacterium]|nr:MAG: peptidoglycan-binding protein [Acidimicrobiia bacterium]